MSFDMARWGLGGYPGGFDPSELSAYYDGNMPYMAMQDMQSGMSQQQQQSQQHSHQHPQSQQGNGQHRGNRDDISTPIDSFLF